MLEQRLPEIVDENQIDPPLAEVVFLGSLTMPEEAKQAYAYIEEEGGQLVLERYATNFDHLAIPID
jgi:hypothetical protein